jgi:hypothetical protein
MDQMIRSPVSEASRPGLVSIGDAFRAATPG